MATCLHCGTQFQHAPRRGRKAKYCSAKCRRSRNAARSKPRTNKLPRREKLRRRRERLRRKIERCPTCGIEFVNAAGRQKFCTHDCAMAAQRIHPPEEYGERECRQCGKVFNKGRNCRGEFCCKPCYFAWTAANGTMIAAHLEVYANRERRAVSDGCFQWLSKWRVCEVCNRRFHSRVASSCCSQACRHKRDYIPRIRRERPMPCPDCGKAVVVYARPKRCDECARAARRASKQRERARYRSQLAAATVELFDPQEIFIRDGWSCQLCGKPILKSKMSPHPRSATLDHIIPLSKGGLHSRKNTQLACWACNIAKNNRSAHDQLRLFG